MPLRPRRSTLLTLALLTSVVGILSARSDAQDLPPRPDEPLPGPPKPPEKPPQEPPKAPETPPQETPKAPESPPKAPAGEPAAPPPAPAAEPAADAPTDEEDAAARKVLDAAAQRQGGASLAAPDGRLDSFRLVFHKVTIHRSKENADGTVTRKRMDSESPGLIVHWKGGQVKTEWHLTGEKPVIRGVMDRTKSDGTRTDLAWLQDGTKTTLLLGDQYAKDREEIERDRRIVRALLQAAVLRSMLTDGSRWKLVDDPAYAGTALLRTPPAGSDQPLRLTLWVDPKSSDVTAAKLSPNQPGESTMTYSLDYHADLPKVKDGVLRFPFHFRVREQRIAEQEPMDVMEAWASEASFNDVPDAEFKPPKN